MDALHISSGPQVGVLLERLREAEAVGEITDREDAIAMAARLLNEMNGFAPGVSISN
jgi:poly(A) polymerase/tRNA nucleotidyltransferase (CCA-adding enzyme)